MILHTKRLILRPWCEDDAEIELSLLGEIHTGHAMLLTREDWEKGRRNI